MSTNKLTTQVIILRKKLAVIPIAFVPVTAVFFSMLGGGSGEASAKEASNAGFDISVPKSEAEDIVASKQEAYEQNNERAYMSGFNMDIVPEMELEEKTDEVWTEEKKDDFDPNSDILSFYEKHNAELESRREIRNYNPPVSQPAAPVAAPAPVQDEVVQAPVASPDPTPEPTQERKSLFHDSQSADNAPAGTATNNAVSIAAVIHGNQEIGGSVRRVKLRTKESATINNVYIPANTIVYANASIAQGRLSLAVSNISLNNKTIPLSLVVYDASDGNPGLNLSTGVTQEEKSRMEGNIIRQSGSMVNRGGIVGNVVTSAGMALGNIFSKNSENSSIQLISNYQVFLK